MLRKKLKKSGAKKRKKPLDTHRPSTSMDKLFFRVEKFGISLLQRQAKLSVAMTFKHLHDKFMEEAEEEPEEEKIRPTGHYPAYEGWNEPPQYTSYENSPRFPGF